MTKGYWVALADVTDPEEYKAYVAENANAFHKFGGRFLTRGGKSEIGPRMCDTVSPGRREIMRLLRQCCGLSS